MSTFGLVRKAVGLLSANRAQRSRPTPAVRPVRSGAQPRSRSAPQAERPAVVAAQPSVEDVEDRAPLLSIAAIAMTVLAAFPMFAAFPVFTPFSALAIAGVPGLLAVGRVWRAG